MAETKSIVLNVSASSYQKHISQLQSYINELVDKKNSLKSYRTKINDIWKGEAADSYKNTMDKQIAQVEKVEKALNQTLAAIQSQLENSGALDSSAMSNIQEATAKIDALF